jgi:hypothetical protein
MRVLVAIALILTSLVGFVISYGLAYQKVSVALLQSTADQSVSGGIAQK